MPNSVVLPAPFGPIMPRASPGASARSMRLATTMAPKRLEICSSARSGAGMLSIRLSRFRLLDRRPDGIRRRRHCDLAHAGRGGGAAFTAGLDAERIGWGEHLGDLDRKGRQRVGARHRVIHQRASERLAGIGIEINLLAHRLTDALGDRAMGLAVHN